MSSMIFIHQIFNFSFDIFAAVDGRASVEISKDLEKIVITPY